MAIAIMVMYFIMRATGATLNKAGQTDINTAADAAQALRPLAGDAAAILLSLGLIGTGALAVPILTGSAAYAVAEALGWKYGLDRKPERAKQFYAVIVIATIIGMALDFLGINPIDALFLAAVINGLLAPPLLVLIMLISNRRDIMAARVNNGWTNVAGWATTVLMTTAALVLLVTWFTGRAG
jgi:Mn2+/Fe2+ NRAMP family transporter